MLLLMHLLIMSGKRIEVGTTDVCTRVILDENSTVSLGLDAFGSSDPVPCNIGVWLLCHGVGLLL